MFSGPLPAILASLATGTTIGVLDTIGFLFTIKLFLTFKKPSARIIMVGLEFVRLATLVIAIVVCLKISYFAHFWLIASAILISILGKIILALKGLNTHGAR